MSNLTITTAIVNNEYVVTASVVSTGDMPTDIFVYENLGDSLGIYQGVCTQGEYLRFRTYAGTPIEVFGNKYLKYITAVVHVPFSMDPTIVSNKIEADVKTFKATYNAAQSNTRVVPL